MTETQSLTLARREVAGLTCCRATSLVMSMSSLPRRSSSCRFTPPCWLCTVRQAPPASLMWQPGISASVCAFTTAEASPDFKMEFMTSFMKHTTAYVGHSMTWPDSSHLASVCVTAAARATISKATMVTVCWRPIRRAERRLSSRRRLTAAR